MPAFVSSILWVPRGVSARHPRTYDLADPGELERVERLGKIKLDDARRELEALEAQVDGMDIEDGKDNADSGDEWADEDEESDDDEDESESEDPEAKARKARERILGAQAAAMQQKQSTDPDDLSKYNLDDYDDDTARTACASIFALQLFWKFMLILPCKQHSACSATLKVSASQLDKMARTHISLWQMPTKRTPSLSESSSKSCLPTIYLWREKVQTMSTC